MYNEITCPYCDFGYDLCHDDGAFYHDGESEKEQCPKCEKYFMVTSHLSWDFSSEKADCLNGSEHDWQPQSGYPREFFFGRFTCSQCEEQECRDEEGRKKALQEYYEKNK